jgi:hypothetical protein
MVVELREVAQSTHQEWPDCQTTDFSPVLRTLAAGRTSFNGLHLSKFSCDQD